MNRLEMAAKSIARMKGAIDDAFIRNIRGVFGEKDDQVLDNVYTKSDLAYVCISTTARAISQAPLKVYTEVEEGVWEEDSAHPWNDRLRRPNYLTDRYSLVESIVIRLMSDGDVWLVPFPLDYVQGIPVSVWVVPKKFMTPLRDKQTGHLTAWQYAPEGYENIPPLPYESVCHMWFFNPNDPILGLAPHEAGGIAIMSDYRAAKYNQLFFKQGASTKGVFSTDQKLTEPQYNQLLEKIRQRGSGMDAAHRDLLIHSGLKYASLASTHKEMEFKELRKFDSSRIMQIYGMKKSVISVTDDINRSISENDKRNWWQATNLPIMRLIQEAMTFTFFGMETNKEFRFDLSNIEALKEDLTGKIKNAKELWVMGFTGNEINSRLELGFDDEPWRDMPYIGNTAQPVDVDGTLLNTPTLPAEPAEFVDQEEMLLLPSPSKSASALDRLEEIWKNLVGEVEPIEDVFQSKMKRAFFRYRQRVLEWLYNSKSVKEVIMTEPLEVGELWLKPYDQLKNEVEDLYQQSMMRGIRTIAGEIGVAVDTDYLARPEALAHLDGKVLNIRGVFRTVQNRITDQLMLGMESGDTMDGLADRVRGVFNVASSRAATIARTEVYEAVNYSRNGMIRESVFEEVQWYTALDERVRETHAMMEGQRKPKGDFWIVGGASLRYPGDYMANAPAETVNCRCIETVVVGSKRRASPRTDEIKQIKGRKGNLKAVSDQRIDRAISKCYI